MLTINKREGRIRSLPYNLQPSENLSVAQPPDSDPTGCLPGYILTKRLQVGFSQKEARTGDWSTKGRKCWGVSFYLLPHFNTSLTEAAPHQENSQLHSCSHSAHGSSFLGTLVTLFPLFPWYPGVVLASSCFHCGHISVVISSLKTPYLNHLDEFGFLLGL